MYKLVKHVQTTTLKLARSVAFFQAMLPITCLRDFYSNIFMLYCVCVSIFLSLLTHDI